MGNRYRGIDYDEGWIVRRLKENERRGQERDAERRLQFSSLDPDFTMTAAGSRETTQMPTPTGVTITAETARLRVVWSGSADEQIPEHFGRLTIHASKFSGFTPTQGTEVATISSPYGGSALYGADGGETYYVRVAIASLRGDYGPFTDEVAVTPTAEPAKLSDLEQDTITGALFRTDESGARVEMGPDPNGTPADSSVLRFYSGLAGETAPGNISADANDTLGYGWLRLIPPSYGGGFRHLDVWGAKSDGTGSKVYVNTDEIDSQAPENVFPAVRFHGLGTNAGGRGALALTGFDVVTGSFSIDGNSRAVVPHDLGVVPDFAQAWAGGTAQVSCSVISQTNAAVTFEVRDNAGNLLTNTSRTLQCLFLAVKS